MTRETGTPVHSELGLVIRSYDPVADLDGLRACIIEQQEFHRGLEPSWPEGEAIIDDYVNYLETQRTLHNGRVIVAECGGNLVGFVCVVASTNGESPDDPAPFAWIHDIFVKAAYRRQHVATRLMAQAESFARAHGAQVLRLGVLARNQGARTFYREHGFRDYVCVLTRSLD
jgi:ribosomal protein S18 acetylase RimI-like enzyme